MEIAIVPIVTGLVQAIKMAGVPSKYAPSLAVVLGVLSTYIVGVDSALLMGVVYGLTAAGLYDIGKSVIK